MRNQLTEMQEGSKDTKLLAKAAVEQAGAALKQAKAAIIQGDASSAAAKTAEISAKAAQIGVEATNYEIALQSIPLRETKLDCQPSFLGGLRR
jgi:hypothetical protein